MADVSGQRVSELSLKSVLETTDSLYVISSSGVSFKLTADKLLTYTFSQIEEVNGGSF